MRGFHDKGPQARTVLETVGASFLAGLSSAAGARRVCVVRAITQAADPYAAARQLQNRLRAAWKDDATMERYTFQALSGAGPQR